MTITSSTDSICYRSSVGFSSTQSKLEQVLKRRRSDCLNSPTGPRGRREEGGVSCGSVPSCQLYVNFHQTAETSSQKDSHRSCRTLEQTRFEMKEVECKRVELTGNSAEFNGADLLKYKQTNAE